MPSSDGCEVVEETTIHEEVSEEAAAKKEESSLSPIDVIKSTCSKIQALHFRPNALFSKANRLYSKSVTNLVKPVKPRSIIKSKSADDLRFISDEDSKVPIPFFPCLVPSSREDSKESLVSDKDSPILLESEEMVRYCSERSIIPLRCISFCHSTHGRRRAAC